MIVDLPEPDGPTRAHTWPASMCSVHPRRISRSGALGYAKRTSRTSIVPNSSSFSFPSDENESITGLRLITSTTLRNASTACITYCAGRAPMPKMRNATETIIVEE